MQYESYTAVPTRHCAFMHSMGDHKQIIISAYQLWSTAYSRLHILVQIANDDVWRTNIGKMKTAAGNPTSANRLISHTRALQVHVNYLINQMNKTLHKLTCNVKPQEDTCGPCRCLFMTIVRLRLLSLGSDLMRWSCFQTPNSSPTVGWYNCPTTTKKHIRHLLKCL
jgi:hypothetical protein